MAVPTRIVTFRVFESDGTPIAGAPIKARMTGTDIYQLQYVDRIEETTVTNAEGIATLALFPNVLGQCDTAYVFTIRHPLDNRKIFQTVAKIPDNDVELTDIMCNTEDSGPAPGFSGTGNGIVVKIKGLYGLRYIYSSDGIEIVNPGGQDGDIGIVLDDDMEAIEALEGYGVPERYGPNLWSQFPITQFGKDLVNLPDSEALGDMLDFLSKSGGTMTGPLYLWKDPVDPLEAATKQYVDYVYLIIKNYVDDALFHVREDMAAMDGAYKAADIILQQNIDNLTTHVDQADALIQANLDAGLANKVDRTGDTMTGYLTLVGPPIDPLHAATKEYVDSGGAGGPGANQAYIDAQDALRVLKAGDTMTGILVLSGDPVNNLDAVTKQYADTHGGAIAVMDDEPVPSMAQGQQWFESDIGGLYMRYINPDATQTLVATGHATGDFIPYAEKAAPFGVAMLDANGDIQVDQIPQEVYDQNPGPEGPPGPKGDQGDPGPASTVPGPAVPLSNALPANAAGTPVAGTSSSASRDDHRHRTPTETFAIACSDDATALTTGTAKATFRMPYAFVVTKIKASLGAASTSGIPTIDVNKNGTSVFSTVLTIDATEKTTATAATAAVLSTTTLADDDEITIDIDVAGTGSKGLKVYILGYQQ